MTPSRRSLGTPRRGPRDRRGATAVFVAVLLVPLIALAALAIDMSWWQAGATQLQTTADAAALSAARAAQLFPNTAETRTLTSAQAMASANRAFGGSATITAADVQPCRYNKTAAAPTCGGVVTWTSTGANTPNAVRVTAGVSAPLSLGGILRTSGPSMTRAATAWIANVNSGTCIKPFGLPYTVLYDAAVRVSGTGTSTDDPRPNLLPAQLAALSAPGTQDARTVVIRGSEAPAATPPPGSTGVTAYDGAWQGYGYAGNNGRPAYQSAFWTCDATVVNVGSTGGTSLSVAATEKPECWTMHALVGSTGSSCNGAAFLTTAGPNAQTCYYKAPTSTGSGSSTVNTYDAGCYASPTATTPGVIVRATWSDIEGTGANALRYREIGRFLIVCAFRGAWNIAAGAGTNRETCTSGTRTFTNQWIGTIVGQVQGISTTTLAPGITLGTVPSDVQKLILVR